MQENQPPVLNREIVDTVRESIGVGLNGTEVGLCRKGEKYFQIAKNVNLGFDIEVELSKDQFDTLWKATDGQQVEADESGESNTEIERKFLIKELPENYESFEHKSVIQGYVVICENKTEVRLRKKGKKYLETIKKGSGKTRLEAEIEITEDQYNALWKTTEGQRVEKTRYEIPREGGKPIELDIYHEKLDGLLTAEVEFSNEEESNNFDSQIPEWFGKEVTKDGRFKNQNLALNGLPDVA